MRWAHIFCTLLIVAVAAPAPAQVVVNDAVDEGLPCFEIVTAVATYYYDKAGAGFTSILDADGNDWIGFHPQGSAPDGQSGWYRGIPNMGLDAFGHPGYAGATSTSSDPLGESLSQVSIHSVKSGWDVTWVFFPTHARMTVTSVDVAYWFLYEGTPGGAVGADDVCWRSSGDSTNLAVSWEGDVTASASYAPGYEWVFFADGTLDRSLFVAHEDDSITDRYYLMDPMTVFGFGRHVANLDRLLTATPANLFIGLVDSRDFDAVGAAIHAATSGTTPPATRDDVEDALRQHRDGSFTNPDVRSRMKRYREQ